MIDKLIIFPTESTGKNPCFPYIPRDIFLVIIESPFLWDMIISKKNNIFLTEIKRNTNIDERKRRTFDVVIELIFYDYKKLLKNYGGKECKKN